MLAAEFARITFRLLTPHQFGRVYEKTKSWEEWLVTYRTGLLFQGFRVRFIFSSYQTTCFIVTPLSCKSFSWGSTNILAYLVFLSLDFCDPESSQFHLRLFFFQKGLWLAAYLVGSIFGLWVENPPPTRWAPTSYKWRLISLCNG